MIKLYNYFRSSTSYRVRIALYLKELPFEYIPVHLVRAGGEHHRPDFQQRNPQELLPTLEDGDVVISQSLAIMEYLDERYPSPPLFPSDPVLRAYARQVALMMACDMHPLGNLRVLQYLTGPLALLDTQKAAWLHHWTLLGLTALEALLSKAKWRGTFCVGDQLSIADCCLVPQLANARRFGVDLSPFPTLLQIEQACLQNLAFSLAEPSRQPDAE